MTELPNIAIVFFTSMTQGTKADISVVDDRPYMYLNNLDLKEGDYALVNVKRPANSNIPANRYNPFRVVQIGRVVPLETSKAAERVHQPLVAKIDIDIKRIRGDYKVIKKALSQIDTARRNSIIDDALGIDRSKEVAPLGLENSSK